MVRGSISLGETRLNEASWAGTSLASRPSMSSIEMSSRASSTLPPIPAALAVRATRRSALTSGSSSLGPSPRNRSWGTGVGEAIAVVAAKTGYLSDDNLALDEELEVELSVATKGRKRAGNNGERPRDRIPNGLTRTQLMERKLQTNGASISIANELRRSSRCWDTATTRHGNLRRRIGTLRVVSGGLPGALQTSWVGQRPYDAEYVAVAQRLECVGCSQSMSASAKRRQEGRSDRAGATLGHSPSARASIEA